MNKENEKAVFAQIDELLTRWRKDLTEPMRDNEALAEEGVNLFYIKAGKKPPLILWCDSPLQTTLIPCLVANILRSDSWQSLVAKMNSCGGSSNSATYAECWKSEWSEVETNTVLPLIKRIWDFQFKDENYSTQQVALERLSEHMFEILKDGRLNSDTVHSKKIKKASPKALWSAPAHLEMWKQFVKLTAEVEKKTSAKFNFNMATARGFVLGVIDYRVLTDRIPAVKDLLKPKDEQIELIKRVEHIKARCTDLERLATARAATLTRAAQGYSRPAFTPTVNPDVQHVKMDLKTFNDLKGYALKNFEDAKKDFELRVEDPHTGGTITWSSSASWLPLALSTRLLDDKILADLGDFIDSWAYMFRGASGYYLCDDVCWVCRHPKTLITNESGQLNSSFGAAATWSDGFDLHCWRGVIVEPDLIKRIRDIKIKEILAEENAEVRRVMLDMFGEERFIRESGATVVNKDKFGTLYRYEFKADEPLQMVRVRNSTRELDGSYKDYYLRVPPEMTSAKAAVAWTFGLTPEEYAPEFET